MPGELPESDCADQQPDEPAFVFRRQRDFITDQVGINSVGDERGDQGEICIEQRLPLAAAADSRSILTVSGINSYRDSGAVAVF